MSRLSDALERALIDRAHAPALISADEMFDGFTLATFVAQMADRLSRLGARRICSALDNGLAWVVLDLAVRRLDAVHVPVPTFFSAAQAAHVANDCDADLWVGAPPSESGWALVLTYALPFADLPIWQRQSRGLALHAGTHCVTYTSGTTGQPKGVCLGADALLDVALSLVSATRVLKPLRHLCLLPLATLLENIAGVYAPLLGGAAVAVPSLGEIGYSGASGLDVGKLMECIRRYSPDSIILVPQLLMAIISAVERGAPLPDTLRFIAVGGARVGATLLARANALGLPVFEGYGLSECASVVALNRPGMSRTGAAGRPLEHTRIRVDGNGELHVAGSIFLGYVGETAPPAAEVATGDIGRVDDDGFVWIEGRRKNIFITAFGRNVSPEWVESELTAHPLIAQALVNGEARPWNAAIIVPRTPTIDGAAVQRAVNEVNAGLPDYARIGRYVVAEAPFTVANGLATTNGRPRREPILQRYDDAIDTLYSSP